MRTTLGTACLLARRRPIRPIRPIWPRLPWDCILAALVGAVWAYVLACAV